MTARALRGTAVLVRLATLRLDLAKRAAMAADAALLAARAAVELRELEVKALADGAERRKQALRDAFVDAPRTLGALGTLLSELREQDGQVADVEARLAQARGEVAAASAHATEARAVRIAAEHRHEKRARMRALLVAAARRAAEAREEAEIADAAAERSFEVTGP